MIPLWTIADIPDDVFGTIMAELPKVVMKHYHSYPELIVYYPKPSKNKAEFENFEKSGFREMGDTRLLYRVLLPDIL